jgi:hypothetical protein
MASATDATVDAMAEIFPASPITAAMDIANATAGNVTASATGSASDATVDATAGNFPASPITAALGSTKATTGNAAASTTAFFAEATSGLFQAFRSLRRPCDDNLYI